MGEALTSFLLQKNLSDGLVFWKRKDELFSKYYAS